MADVSPLAPVVNVPSYLDSILKGGVSPGQGVAAPGAVGAWPGTGSLAAGPATSSGGGAALAPAYRRRFNAQVP